ncbi:hypothetical protein LPW11_18535 [Geomonas sp. RF6]|uniref:hypothetical protein n=1 Tax=Geomonas sp. RF6 TaxID=2897342 RepID=UPI001E45CCBF|nr:hypothetical protein [Geomonas sp. RF6]UFS69871.1 hypothetical protein LPW11_18535 [Geomonas sp. RF6]
MERHGEMIRVAAIFAPGSTIRPVWFEWRKKKHAVTELSYFWKDREGDATRLHFAVSDGANLFELIYNSSDHNWTLEGVVDE